MNREGIILAAADLFESKGYSATSMRDLAEKVGLMPSSLYSHINSKQEILKEICMSCADLFTKGMEEILMKADDPELQLQKLIMLHIETAYDHPSSIAVFNDDWRHLNEKDLVYFQKMRTQYEKNFKEILIQGKKSHKFSFQNLEIVFVTILSSFKWAYKGVDKFPKNLVIDELNHFILNALKY
ncbi:MAG: TetR/AcrR family transcriptional regulator [Saprospiraceae bacterium]